jgi:hypothetical protein
MTYRKKGYEKFVQLAYTIFYIENFNGEELKLCQENVGLFLSIGKRSVPNYLMMLEDKHICKRNGKNRKLGNNKYSRHGICTFDVDFELFEHELTELGLEIKSYDALVADYGDYCNFCKAVSKAQKKSDHKLSKAEIEKVVLDEEQRRIVEFNNLCNKHGTYLRKLDDLNNYYKNRGFSWQYLTEQKRRLTNPLCSTRNPEKSSDYKRYDLISQILGIRPSELDIASSIYNTSFGLGTGAVAEIDTDFYEVVMLNTTNLDFEPNEWPTIRRYAKLLFMPVYMREGSLKFKELTFEKRCENAEYLNRADRAMLEAEKWLTNRFQLPLYNILDEIRKSLHEVLNLKKFFQRDIFLYESDLHINVMWHLLFDYKIEVLNVYDGFYYDPQIENFEQIFRTVYKQSFEELLNTKELKEDIAKNRITELKAA